MKHPLSRISIIALITFLLGSSVAYLTNLETTLGLDTLFKLRGIRHPPAEVVVIAMDEASEELLKVGHDLTRWRRFHTQLIRELMRQGATLVVFDLQFISARPDDDPVFAAAMREAGNVLSTDCVQKLRRGVEDFYGRDECADKNATPFVHKTVSLPKTGSQQQPLPEQFVAMRKLPPTPKLAAALLEHAPFYLSHDAEYPITHESWTFFDSLAEMPSLPLLTWVYSLHRSGMLAISPAELPLSNWLSNQRRQCLGGIDQSSKSHPNHSDFQLHLNELICGEDTRYLDFYGPPQTFRMESYSDVYAGKVNDLKDKIAFVGKANRKYSPGKTDFFQTPFTVTRSGEMAGVEIMATQFANLLEGRFVQSPYPPSIMFLTFGLLLGLTLTCFTGFTGLLVSILMSAVYAGVAFWLFSQQALWLPIAVPILVQLPLAMLMSLVWSRWDLLSERKRILEFVRQVFPQWVKYMPGSPGQWYPEKNSADFTAERDVRGICLATDIEGYTAVAGRYTPHQMWELLSDYYQILGHSVHAHEGIIADITGDAMMAVWIDQTANSRRLAACFAALEMDRAVERFNEASKADRLPTRIGLHEGDITLGRLDTGAVSHYRAIGDSVNTASRIQGVNKYLGTKILASAEIVANLAHFTCRPMGHFRLIGLKEPVALFEVVGITSEVNNAYQPLHQQFALGLGHFQTGKWTEAINLFQSLLDEQGHDGPTKFYLDLAITLQAKRPEAWDGVISLAGK